MKKEYFGLIGEHLSHSYSNLIHHELGCADYLHTELEKSELSSFIADTKIGLMNVTIPYKKDVMPFLDSISEDALKVGSVNTVVTDDDGRLVGHNTDVYGVLWMAENAGISLKDKKVLILGSGGASLAVIRAAQIALAREIIVVSRSGEVNYGNVSLHNDADVIVNATPVGMFPECDGKIIDLSIFEKCEGVIDLIYNPFRTNLLLQAKELNKKCTNGLSMLVSQAKRAREIYSGEKIDDGEILRIMKIIASKTRNIALVGMPGSGKSTVGKVLSEITGKELVDIDDYIVKTEGTSIPDIFKKGGESLFRSIESEAIAKACAKTGCIIVTGGGAVTVERNYAPLKRCARIYHLEREISDLARKGRPLSIGADLNEMYRARHPFYKKFADATVAVAETPEATAKKILEDFYENSCN